MKYEVDIIPNEHGGYYARVPDYPSLFTGGDTYDEAMHNALEAIDLMLEDYQERQTPPPQPKSRYKGRFNVRVPKTLHRELTRLAEHEGVSLNAMVNYLLLKATGTETS